MLDVVPNGHFFYNMLCYNIVLVIVIEKTHRFYESLIS